MKKIILSLLILFSGFPFVGSAATATGGITAYDMTYSDYRNEYILNYAKNVYADTIYVYFETVTGTPYDITFSGVQHVNGRFFLTCNGNYWFYLKNNSNTVGSITGLVTSEIENPGCQSKPPTFEDPKDLDLTAFNNNGVKKLRFNKFPYQGSTQLYKYDGTQFNPYFGATYSDNDDYRFWTVPENGIYKVSTYGSGELADVDTVTMTDNLNGNTSENQTEQPQTDCTGNGCDFLTEVLACPGWEQYMGDLSDALSQSVPPAPDWDDVALKIKTAINLGSNLNEFKNNLINTLKNEEQDPIAPTAPTPYDPDLDNPLTDLTQPITVDLSPDPNAYDPVMTGTGSGAVNITDPTAWVPDDNDMGYTTTGTPATDPGYDPPTTTPETPPSYNIGNPASDTAPTYTITNPASDTIPGYTISNPASDTPPNYNINNGNTNTPNYNYIYP